MTAVYCQARVFEDELALFGEYEESAKRDLDAESDEREQIIADEVMARGGILWLERMRRIKAQADSAVPVWSEAGRFAVLH